MRNRSIARVPDKRPPQGRLIALTWLTALLMLGVWAVQRFTQQGHWFSAGVTYAPQHGLAVLPLWLLVVALAKRRRGVALANLGLLLAAILGFVGFNLRLGRAEGPAALRVMVYNVQAGRVDAQGVVDTVRRADADVVCLLERPPDALLQTLAETHGYEVLGADTKVRGDSATLLTRLPVRRREVWRQPDALRHIVEADLAVDGRAVTVFALHLSKPESGSIPMLLTAASRADIAQRAERRREQLQVALDRAAQVTGPVIVAGDFNTPPRGALHRTLEAGFTNAFEAAGWGTGHTFPAGLPLLRIDHVWVRGLGVAGCRALPVAASDHRPLVADLVWPQDGAQGRTQGRPAPVR